MMVDMNREDLTGRAFRELRRQILNFRLLPGVRISDKEVAEVMGLSRTPVREALIRLAGQGLVQARHNRGFTVRVFTIKEVEDLYTLRENLETMAVRLATERMDREKEKALRLHLERYPGLVAKGNLVRFNETDNEFHDLIARMSGNDLLAKTLGGLHDQLRLVRRYQHLHPDSFRHTYQEHGRIVDYMVLGEARQARTAISRHILNSMALVIKMLESEGGGDQGQRK